MSQMLFCLPFPHVFSGYALSAVHGWCNQLNVASAFLLLPGCLTLVGFFFSSRTNGVGEGRSRVKSLSPRRAADLFSAPAVLSDTPGRAEILLI